MEKEEKEYNKSGNRKILLTKDEINYLRRAQVVVSTAIHPDTNEFIPWTMRCSSFLPMNIPISFGFIIAAPTPFNTIFWQWINQTYNASFNYGNRNATSLYTTSDIMKSYAAAVVSSISVALAIRKALSGRTNGMTGPKLIFFNSISSFFACSTAGFLNAWFMRRTELEKGIDVYDEKGKCYGKS
jgi:sideroflexin-5